MKNRKNRKLSDASVVAALLLANVPGLAEKCQNSGILPREPFPEKRHSLQEYLCFPLAQSKLVSSEI